MIASSSSWNVGLQRVVVVVIVAALLLLLVASSSSASSASTSASSRAGTTDDEDDAELQTLLRRAHEMISQDTNTNNNNDGSSNNAGDEYKAIWKRIRKLRPRWAEANARYGMILLEAPRGGIDQKNAIELLRRSIDVRSVDDPIPLNSTQGMIFATTVGRYYHSIDRTVRAIPIIDDAYNANHDDLCLALMSSTMVLHQVPTSMEKEDEIVSEYLIRTNTVLTRLTQQQQQQQQQQTRQSQTLQSQSQSLEKWTMDEQYLSQTFPGAASDPYEHCMISESCIHFIIHVKVFGDTTCLCAQFFT
jgi:flagellar motor protein MotB